MSFPRPRTIIYTVLAALLAMLAVWEGIPKPAGNPDEFEISAARRIPHTASAEDAIY
jgi:predicted small integral membrane protein